MDKEEKDSNKYILMLINDLIMITLQKISLKHQQKWSIPWAWSFKTESPHCGFIKLYDGGLVLYYANEIIYNTKEPSISMTIPGKTLLTNLYK